jgi:hypothetical protein
MIFYKLLKFTFKMLNCDLFMSSPFLNQILSLKFAYQNIVGIFYKIVNKKCILFLFLAIIF